MAARGSNSTTALRRLMTEYKQLTSGGTDSGETIEILLLTQLLVVGSPDGMFTAGVFMVTSPICCIQRNTPQGPISESDFFTWEALICGPKDTPFVSH